MKSPSKETPFDIEVQEAVREILALRALTKSTGNHTTYAQNVIIRKLSPTVLTRVAVILAELESGGNQ